MLNENTTHHHEDQPETGGDPSVLRMIPDWTDANTAAFQKEIMSFRHGLAETGLFTDEALIDLLERHPTEKLDVCTMSDPDHPVYPNKFRTGDFRDVSGKVLLEAVKAGCVWVNLREAMNVNPDYKIVLDEMYGSLSKKTGNLTFNPKGGILISSPVAKVPYHFDKTETILWHVRGKKRMYIYPLTQKFISDTAYENTITNYMSDDLPYDASFDAHAEAIDIPEGAALMWPLNSPHRVDNRTFCVSVTTEYSTRESAMKNAAMVTNATLRHHLGLKPSYEKDGNLTRKVKSVAGRVLRKTPIVPDNAETDLVTFRIDETSDNYMTDVEPFPRTF